MPQGCAGFADGDTKYMAERGAGSFVNIDDTDPVGARALRKLKGQDYASAGLVDAGPEKFFVRRGPEGRWCPACPNNTIHHSWTRSCPSCGAETVPESEMARALPAGPYVPLGARVSDCRFCEIIRDGDYAEKDELMSCVLFEPLCGTTARHMLAVPVQHVERADDDPEVFGRVMAAAARYARRHAIGDFNVIQSNGRAATQGIPHVHAHIVPRVPGDGEGRTWPWTAEPTHLNPGTGHRGACGCVRA